MKKIKIAIFAAVICMAVIGATSDKSTEPSLLASNLSALTNSESGWGEWDVYIYSELEWKCVPRGWDDCPEF